MPATTTRSAPARLQLIALAIVITIAVSGCRISVEHEGASDRGPSLHEQIDDLASEYVTAASVAGISAAISRDGEIVLARGYGHADLENDVGATAQTVYRIGSITKQFTAAAIMRLIEAGQLSLASDLGTLMPDFPTEGHQVTVEHLLNHTSGIPSYTGLETFWSVSRLDLTHAELLDLVDEPAFDFAPGEQWSYNNTGYYLLGMLIEQISGRDYATYLQEEFFEPLGLKATTYCGERKLIPWRAEGYELVDGELVNDEALSMNLPYAAGALCSTVGDLLRWQHALASGEVVSAASYASMTTPRTLASGEELTYGFGLGIGELEGHRRIAHGGGINGFVTMLAEYPDDNLGVVVLTNTGGPVASELAAKIARAALELEPAPEDAERP